MQACRGFAPRYDAAARQALQAALIAARHVLAETCGPMLDLRSNRDLLPEMLKGWSQLPGASGRSAFSRISALRGARHRLVRAHFEDVRGCENCLMLSVPDFLGGLQARRPRLQGLPHRTVVGWLCRHRRR